MVGHRVRRAAQAAAIAFSFSLLFAVVALAQERAGDAGRFDFYVLALSWSPSYCARTQERVQAQRRVTARKPETQCAGRPFAFVVHGLWPQFERAFPSYCQAPARRLDAALVSGMLELMPSPRLILHEWNRHGTCSGHTVQGYFDTVRKARAAIAIPEVYRAPAAPLRVTPAEVTAAFIKANPGLTAGAMAVACDKKRLTEVRLCLGKDLSFRACAQIARRNCRRDKLVMPAVRGE